MKYLSIDNFIDDNLLLLDGMFDIVIGYDVNGIVWIDLYNIVYDDSWWESVMYMFGFGDVNFGMLFGGIVFEVGGGLFDVMVFGVLFGVVFNVVGIGLIYMLVVVVVVNFGYDFVNCI